MTTGALRGKAVAAAALVALAAMSARAEMKCFRPDGKIIEVTELIDDEIAFAKYAETATIVAFDRLPRPNLLHSWKSLGITVLQTVRLDAEMSPEHYRRETGFLAFLAGADGLYLVGEPKGEYARALEEAKTDWQVLEYLRELREKAQANKDGLVRIEGRRATYCMQSYLPVDRGNLDMLRLDAVAWAKRLEAAIGLPHKDLPTTLPAKPLPEFAVFTPYAGRSEPPKTVDIGEEGQWLKLAEGLKFRWSNTGFTIAVESAHGKKIAGGVFTLRLYISGNKPGEWLPYCFTCDLGPRLKGDVRAPAIGRNGNLFGTDERFLPYSQIYGASVKSRLREWPRLRTSGGPDCPALNPRFSYTERKDGGVGVTFEFNWISLYGHWPLCGTAPKGPVWYVGVDSFPGSGEQVAACLQWPRPNEQWFDKICATFSTKQITEIYKDELVRGSERWQLGLIEHNYNFLETKEPCFNLGERASDDMFHSRMVQPLLDANANAWDLIWDDKEHPVPMFGKQPILVRKRIYRMLGRMIYLSRATELLRRDYLVGRFAGKEPPMPKLRESKDSPKLPDMDFDDNALELDEKEF